MKYNLKTKYFTGPENILYILPKFFGKILKIGRTYKIKHSNEFNK